MVFSYLDGITLAVSTKVRFCSRGFSVYVFHLDSSLNKSYREHNYQISNYVCTLNYIICIVVLFLILLFVQQTQYKKCLKKCNKEYWKRCRACMHILKRRKKIKNVFIYIVICNFRNFFMHYINIKVFYIKGFILKKVIIILAFF